MHHPFAAQVDPRTGLLQFHLPLVTIIGNDHLGPEFALSLNYSLLDLEDVSYGKGFSANLSRYDPVSRLLTLSNGEQYRLDGNESDPAFSPPAPLHLRLKKFNEALWVYYKSGVVEQLIIPQAKGVAQKHYLLNRVFSPTGYEIIFTYVALNGRLRLAQIKDAQQSLVEINWTALSPVDSQTPSSHQIQLVVWPGLPQNHSVFLLKEQSKLTQMSKYDNFDTTRCGAGAVCQLGYDHQDRLVSLSLPGGINESFTYCADGAVRSQPCIESHSTRVMDNHTTLYQQTQTFHFTDIDFLNTDDPLSRPGMLSPGQSYSSHIHIIREHRSPLTHEAPSPGSENVTRHYDSYHRLVSEEHLTDITLNNQRKRSEHRILLTYPHPVNDVTTMPLAQLPRTYCLPSKKEELWRSPFFDGSMQHADPQPERGEVTNYNYDIDGNLTLCIYPDGSLFTLTYFSAGGNLPECPADPLGFCRFAAEVSFEIPPQRYPDDADSPDILSIWRTSLSPPDGAAA
ncbi:MULTISPECIES: hypothetical protein [Enterobacterales]|uniref:Uncharacterized protein n=1 Tax=Candidatus Sodalis endolongispinus TaxID=2812662 RepID=A0ABS5YD24_9GAMM|nr:MULTISPECIES: hypothetical protein [Enterobacterales]MBG6247519.1 hypothetical protein [Candidatus Symbiopectobacterium sp. PLON1]MBT9432602.1 hypothetical protein [Candidatus Sodalis endolongispinus]